MLQLDTHVTGKFNDGLVFGRGLYPPAFPGRGAGRVDVGDDSAGIKPEDLHGADVEAGMADHVQDGRAEALASVRCRA